MKFKSLLITSLASLVTLVSVPSLAQANLFNLNAQLQQAVGAQNWQRAIQIVDQMIVAAPQKATELKSYRVELQRLLKVGAKVPKASLNQSPHQATRRGTAGSLGQVPIKRWDGGVAVIDTIFNGRRQFEMIVDSGASLTIITRPMAAALGLTPTHVIDQIVLETANGKTVMPLVYVNTIEVGGLLASQVPVAIAGSDMTIGLLGQDFLRRYDVSFKKDMIEFHNRPNN
jgi:aspartyl protease family protein